MIGLIILFIICLAYYVTKESMDASRYPLTFGTRNGMVIGGCSRWHQGI